MSVRAARTDTRLSRTVAPWSVNPIFPWSYMSANPNFPKSTVLKLVTIDCMCCFRYILISIMKISRLYKCMKVSSTVCYIFLHRLLLYLEQLFFFFK